jgi:hypothetical protein
MGAGVPDLDAGTITYTWATIRAAAFDPATHKPRCSRTAPGLLRSRRRDELARSRRGAAPSSRPSRPLGGRDRRHHAQRLRIATDQRSQAKICGALQLVQATISPRSRWKGRQRLDQHGRGDVTCMSPCSRAARPSVLHPREGDARRCDRC